MTWDEKAEKTAALALALLAATNDPLTPCGAAVPESLRDDLKAQADAVLKPLHDLRALVSAARAAIPYLQDRAAMTSMRDGHGDGDAVATARLEAALAPDEIR